MKRVLLTDGHYKHARALAKQFFDLDYEVHCVGVRSSPNFFSRYMNFLPRELSNSFFDKDSDLFLQHLKECKYELLVPVGAQSVKRVSEIRQHLMGVTSVVLASEASLELAFSKKSMGAIAESEGIRFPKTFSYHDLVSCRNFNGRICMKFEDETHKSMSTKYFASQKEALVVANGLSEKDKELVIFQEVIEGPGEGFFAIYNNGTFIQGYTHKRIREYPPSGGSSTCAQVTNSVDTFEQGQKLLNRINWHGVAMVEFKRSLHSGDLYLMEVNPKFWGSLELGIAAGLNFAYQLQQLMEDDKKNEGESRLLRNIVYQWPFDGDLAHLLRLNTCFQVIRDLFDFRVKKNVYLSDFAVSFLTPIFACFYKMAALFQRFPSINSLIKRSLSDGPSLAFRRLIEEKLGTPIRRDSEYAKQLFVGPHISKLGKLRLSRWGVSTSVNLQEEFNDESHGVNFKKHLHLPCKEYESLALHDVARGVNFIDEAVRSGEKVYVHCREGVSRAPYLVCAYLMSIGIEFDEAYAAVKAIRPQANLLLVHRKSLEEYAAFLRTNNSAEK
jgi:predicted ATP-grasp superfamily ATP-dependent carboligase/protein-tyrosine phosphatase